MLLIRHNSFLISVTGPGLVGLRTSPNWTHLHRLVKSAAFSRNLAVIVKSIP